MTKFANYTNCVNCIPNSPLFCNLSDSDKKLVDTHRNEVMFQPGEIIIKQGTSCTHAICFTSGLAKVYIEGESGKNVIISVLKPYAFVTGPGMYGDSRHHFSVAALEKCYACFIEIDTIKDMVINNKHFATGFLKEIARNSVYTLDLLVNLTQKQSTGRLAYALLYLCESVYNSNPFTLTLSKLEVSELAGITRKSASQILREFRDEGIISEENGKFEIINEKLLAQISKYG